MMIVTIEVIKIFIVMKVEGNDSDDDSTNDNGKNNMSNIIQNIYKK